MTDDATRQSISGRTSKAGAIGRIAKRLVARGPGDRRHSEAYRILCNEYETVRTRLCQQRPGWSLLAAELVAEGLVGRGGQTISGDSLRKTWKRVCRDVARLRAAESGERAQVVAPQRPPPPSRMPADWRPEPVVPPPPPQWPARASAIATAAGGPRVVVQPPSRSTGPPMPVPDPRASATPPVPTISLRPLVNGLPSPDETPEEAERRVDEEIAKAVADMQAVDRRKFCWP